MTKKQALKKIESTLKKSLKALTKDLDKILKMQMSGTVQTTTSRAVKSSGSQQIEMLTS